MTLEDSAAFAPKAPALRGEDGAANEIAPPQRFQGQSVGAARAAVHAPSLAPRAVTELELAEDAGAEAFPRWRIHDRTHLELAVEYRPEPAELEGRFEWEAFFFVPESFRLDPRSYDKDEFWADFRSYVRLAAPHASFGELTAEPIERLARALRSGDPAMAGRELRLFACRVRRAGIEAHDGILAAVSSDPARAARLAEAFARDSGQLAQALRDTLRDAPDAGERARAVRRWVDEDVSLVIETLLADAAQALSAPETEAAREAALARAVAEARYRREIGYEAVIAQEERDRHAEALEFRRHTLKRFTSSVLWLSSEVFAPGAWARHALFGIAAGVAMAFAIAAAVYNGFSIPNDGRLAIWLVGAVVAYAIKDRLKAGLQEVFSGYLSQHFPDRRWRLHDKERRAVLGRVDEQSGFASFDRLPPDVLAARRLTREHPIEEEARPETVLWHKKAVTIETEALHKADERFDALVEIFRLDLARWLRHTDDAKAKLVFANPATNTVETLTAPRVYNIGVVYRWRRPDSSSPWHRIRVVVSRKGIRRIDAIC